MFEDITDGSAKFIFRESEEFELETKRMDSDNSMVRAFTNYRGWRLGDRFLNFDHTLDSGVFDAPKVSCRLISIVKEKAARKDKKGNWRGLPKIFPKNLLTFYFVDERFPDDVMFFHREDLACCKKL